MAPLGPWKWTPEALEELARDLLEWVEDPDHYFLKEFSAERGFAWTCISRFCRQSPAFAEAVDRTNDILECRLLRGGLEGKSPTSHRQVGGQRQVRRLREERPGRVRRSHPTHLVDDRSVRPSDRGGAGAPRHAGADHRRRECAAELYREWVSCYTFRAGGGGTTCFKDSQN